MHSQAVLDFLGQYWAVAGWVFVVVLLLRVAVSFVASDHNPHRGWWQRALGFSPNKRRPTPAPPEALRPETWVTLFFVTQGADHIFRNRVEHFDSEAEALEFMRTTDEAARAGFRGAFREIAGFNRMLWEQDPSFRGPERLPPLTKMTRPPLKLVDD